MQVFSQDTDLSLNSVFLKLLIYLSETV